MWALAAMLLGMLQAVLELAEKSQPEEVQD